MKNPINYLQEALLVKKVNIHEVLSGLTAILEDLEKGESFVLCQNGKPLATIAPHQKKQHRCTCGIIKNLKVQYDPMEELALEELE